MGHTDRRRIGAWLKDLRAKHYIEWIYDPNDFAAKTKPAIYYLGINGIRFLRTTGEYPTEELNKRYYDNARKADFRERCLLLASCCVSLEMENRQNDANKNNEDGDNATMFTYITQTDYIDPDSEYYKLTELEPLRPQLFIREYGQGKHSDQDIVSNYLLEVIDASLPRYQLSKKLKDYVKYLDSGAWGYEQELEGPIPTVLLVCPNLATLIYAKRRTRALIAEVQDEEDEDLDEADKLHIRFITVEHLKRYGVASELWEG